MTKTELPPLPKPQSTVLIAHTERGLTSTTWRTPGKDYFEDDDMHAHAAAALAPLEADLENWKAMVWALARVLNCLPSTYSDSNAHVFKAAEKLVAEVERLRMDAEWIPVGERLPEHGQTVQIGWADKKPRSAVAIFMRGKWRDPNAYSKDEEWYRPTHWRRFDMPAIDSAMNTKGESA